MKKNDVKIAYIGGGSRGWARTFMYDIAIAVPMRSLSILRIRWPCVPVRIKNFRRTRRFQKNIL